MSRIKLGIERLFEGADIAGGLDRVIGELEVTKGRAFFGGFIRTFSIDPSMNR